MDTLVWSKNPLGGVYIPKLGFNVIREEELGFNVIKEEEDQSVVL